MGKKEIVKDFLDRVIFCESIRSVEIGELIEMGLQCAQQEGHADVVELLQATRRALQEVQGTGRRVSGFASQPI